VKHFGVVLHRYITQPLSPQGTGYSWQRVSDPGSNISKNSEEWRKGVSAKAIVHYRKRTPDLWTALLSPRGRLLRFQEGVTRR